MLYGHETGSLWQKHKIQVSEKDILRKTYKHNEDENNYRTLHNDVKVKLSFCLSESTKQ